MSRCLHKCLEKSYDVHAERNKVKELAANSDEESWVAEDLMNSIKST